jgi:hypothetical protein
MQYIAFNLSVGHMASFPCALELEWEQLPYSSILDTLAVKRLERESSCLQT